MATNSLDPNTIADHALALASHGWPLPAIVNAYVDGARAAGETISRGYARRLIIGALWLLHDSSGDEQEHAACAALLDDYDRARRAERRGLYAVGSNAAE